MRRRAVPAALLLLGCAAVPPPTAPPAASIHPDVAPLAWMVGRFVGPGGAEETWVPAGDVLVGVGFRADGEVTREWEVMFVRREGDRLVLVAMPGGRAPTSFALVEQGERSATFANPAHDAPKSIGYRRMRDTLVAEVDGAALPAMMVKELTKAPGLEAADRRFAADVAARGLAAWTEAFAEGRMGTPTGPIEGAAIVEAMRSTLAPGRALEWAPTHSGLSPAGDLGFTVGEYSMSEGLPPRPGESATQLGRGAYVTIWKRSVGATAEGGDGPPRFHVHFDVGDPVGGSPR